MDFVLGTSEAPGDAIPMVDVAPDGTLFVVHYETGADGRPSVVATRRAPQGAIVSQVVTEEPLGAHEYHGFDAVEWSIYGDYSGVSADEHGAVATWVGGEPDNQDLMATFMVPVR